MLPKDGFKWSDDTPVEYINWDVDEPGEDPETECVQLVQTGGLWSTQRCAATRNWICKIDKRKRDLSQVCYTPGQWIYQNLDLF